MASPSKNQRAGKKSVQRKIVCPKGHVMYYANMATRGRKHMILTCECEYAPLLKSS